jgi:transposase
MEYYVGIDVSLKESSVCVVGARGAIIRELKVASEPEALCDLVGGFGFPVTLIDLEAGPLSQCLTEAALSAMTVKTDRKDARGIAQLLRMGWYRPVHAKSVGAQEVRALLVGR